MPGSYLDNIEQTIRSTLSHLKNAGSFNEGQANQVSSDTLSPEVKARVDQLASYRDTITGLQGTEKHSKTLQDAINFLYNPTTRDAAMSSWAQLKGDESNDWSATGGHLPSAAGIVNRMTIDPEHNLYGGMRK